MKVVVVDDSRLSVSALQNILAKLGHEIVASAFIPDLPFNPLSAYMYGISGSINASTLGGTITGSLGAGVEILNFPSKRRWAAYLYVGVGVGVRQSAKNKSPKRLSL